MGTQKRHCIKNNRKKADYVLALKDNQKNFHNDVKDYFEAALKDKTGYYVYKEYKKSELGHGRIKTRTHYFTNVLSGYP